MIAIPLGSLMLYEDLNFLGGDIKQVFLSKYRMERIGFNAVFQWP